MLTTFTKKKLIICTILENRQNSKHALTKTCSRINLLNIYDFFLIGWVCWLSKLSSAAHLCPIELPHRPSDRDRAWVPRGSRSDTTHNWLAKVGQLWLGDLPCSSVFGACALPTLGDWFSCATNGKIRMSKCKRSWKAQLNKPLSID